MQGGSGSEPQQPHCPRSRGAQGSEHRRRRSRRLPPAPQFPRQEVPSLGQRGLSRGKQGDTDSQEEMQLRGRVFLQSLPRLVKAPGGVHEEVSRDTLGMGAASFPGMAMDISRTV